MTKLAKELLKEYLENYEDSSHKAVIDNLNKRLVEFCAKKIRDAQRKNRFILTREEKRKIVTEPKDSIENWLWLRRYNQVIDFSSNRQSIFDLSVKYDDAIEALKIQKKQLQEKENG